MGDTISVGSTVYNLAGEEKDRPQFLKSLLLRNILSGTEESVGNTITNGYLNGPAMRLKQFFKWAKKSKNYGMIGMPTGSIDQANDLNPADLEPHIPTPSGKVIWCQYAVVGIADTVYWAQQWVGINRPAALTTGWVSEYKSTTNKITIRFIDGSTVSFTPANFVLKKYYVYAYYIIVTNSASSNTVSFSTDQMYIYRIGSGKPAIDALVKNRGSFGEFFPFIPIRIDEHFLSTTYHPTAYKQVKKAFKKATSGKLDELIENLKDNDDLDDVDHAYVVFGVSLNVVDMSCKRYLYKFFEKLMFGQIGGPDVYNKWVTVAAAEYAKYIVWRDWKRRHGAYGGRDDDKPDPGPEPARPRSSSIANNGIQITGVAPFVDTDGSEKLDYDVQLYWAYIKDGRGNGLGRAGARKNDCWLVYIGEDTVARKYYTAASLGDEDNSSVYEKFRIYWQHQETFNGVVTNFYTYLEVVGMRHKNEIYKGQAVRIGAKEALKDKDESGFIVPLHYEIWQDTRIVDSSQMGTACIFIVFNSYTVTKKKWYESGIFRIFLVIIIAIVSVVFTGGAGLGLLGAHLSVGAALGFSGLTAAIVGAVVNAIAALVLTTILQKVATALGVIGPIVAAILGILIGNVISAFQAGTAFTFDWMSLFKADNLMKLTEAVGGSVQQIMRNQVIEMQQESQRIAKESETQLQKVEETYASEFGANLNLDYAALFSTNQEVFQETVSTFLARTTMTGTDIVELSQDIIHKFSDLSLKLPDAFV